MIRGTTPTHFFTLPFDGSVVSSVRIVYSQNDRVVFVKCGSDVRLNGDTLETKLTQDETLLFDCEAWVEIQVRVLTAGGDALGSDILRVPVSRCLENEVIA